MTYEIIDGGCLVEMPKLIERGVTVDAVIADLPFEKTQNSWDEVIPFAPMWANVKELLRRGKACVFFGQQPFTSRLICSNLPWFKWEDIWRKSAPTGHLNCNVMPLRQHENILVFGEGAVTFNPQMGRRSKAATPQRYAPSACYGKYGLNAERTAPADEAFPRSVIDFNTAYHDCEAGLHPNQKPVELMRYLVRTYTNPGDTVLDFTAGSFSTGVACVIERRNFIGIERSEEYCAIGEARMKRASGEWVAIPTLNRKPQRDAPLFAMNAETS